MPIYEYRCQACGAELEKLQKLSDPLLTECPECGRETLVKLVSASSFRLKGGGWYETDFKTGKKKNGAGEADNAGDSAGKTAGTDATGATGKDAGDGSGNKKGEKSDDRKSDNKSEKTAARETASVAAGGKTPASSGAGTV